MEVKQEGKLDLIIPDEDEYYYFDTRMADAREEFKVIPLDTLERVVQ